MFENPPIFKVWDVPFKNSRARRHDFAGISLNSLLRSSRKNASLRFRRLRGGLRPRGLRGGLRGVLHGLFQTPS